MVHQKESKKIAEKLQHEKQERDSENKKWIEKYDSVLKNYERKLE